MTSFFQNLPAIRTSCSVPRTVRRRAVSAGTGLCLIVPFCISVIAFALSILVDLAGLATLSDLLNQVAALMMLSFIGIIPCLFLAIPIALWALKIGYAGWLCALTSGGLVAYVFFEHVMEIKPEGLPIGVGFGLTFSALFWLGLRRSTPAAFLVDGTRT